MRKKRIVCPVCNVKKDFDVFDEELDMCLTCAEEAHAAALAECAQRERDKNAPREEKRSITTAQEEHRVSERNIAPPKVYPYPWGPKNGKR